VNRGELYLAVPALTIALRETAGASVSEPFVAALLEAAPHISHRHKTLGQASVVLAYWRTHPGFTPSAAPPDKAGILP
jgi:hypothetical protein